MPKTSSPSVCKCWSKCRPTKPPIPVISARTTVLYGLATGCLRAAGPLVGPLRAHVPAFEVLLLLVSQDVDAHAKALQLEPRNVSIDLLRNVIDARRQRPVILRDVDGRERLIGEA